MHYEALWSKIPIAKIALSLLGVMFYLQSVSAQDSIVDQEVEVNGQAWLDYNFRTAMKDSRFLSTQVGFRTINPAIFNRFLGISTLNLRAKSWFKRKQQGAEPWIRSYHLGAGIIYTNNFNEDNNFEFRLIQGMKFAIPTIKGFKIYNYSRIEERFQYSFDGLGWDTGFRLRHRFSITISWKKHFLHFTEGFYFPISAELFFNLKRTDRFNDLIRLSPGIGYKFENGLKLELYAIYNRTRNLTETNNASNDLILRLRIFKEKPNQLTPLAPANEFDESGSEDQNN